MAPAKTKTTPQEEFDFDTFEFKCLEDFKIYNDHVRKFNRTVDEKKRMKIKVPDKSFHKTMKVKFQRFDQPQNVLKVYLRNAEIEYEAQLKASHTYDLPIPVIKFLNKLAVPIFKEVPVVEDGVTLTETKQVGEESRFSCQVTEMVA